MRRRRDEWGAPLAFGPAGFLLGGQIVCLLIRGERLDAHGIDSIGNLLFWIGFAAVFAAPAAIVWTDQEDSTLYAWLAVAAGLVALVVSMFLAFVRICPAEACS